MELSVIVVVPWAFYRKNRSIRAPESVKVRGLPPVLSVHVLRQNTSVNKQWQLRYREQIRELGIFACISREWKVVLKIAGVERGVWLLGWGDPGINTWSRLLPSIVQSCDFIKYLCHSLRPGCGCS